MSWERLLEYGLGTALVVGLLAPLVWRLVSAMLEDRKNIVQTQERIAQILENHLGSIGRTLAVIETRMASIDRRTEEMYEDYRADRAAQGDRGV